MIGHCWLGGINGIQRVKNEGWYVGSGDLTGALLVFKHVWLLLLPSTSSCCSKIQTGSTFWYWLNQVCLGNLAAK